MLFHLQSLRYRVFPTSTEENVFFRRLTEVWTIQVTLYK